MGRARTRVIKRKQYAGLTWKEKWTIFKHNRRKPGCWELFTYGLLMNIMGFVLLFLKAQLDKDVIEASVQKMFREAGIKQNGTEYDEREPVVEPNSLLMVFITMAGRMANVVGTMKMYKALGRFFTERKRKKFRTTTERLQNGETEAECTELLAECFQVC